MSAARRAVLALGGVLLAVVAVPFASTAAFAHDALVGTDPASGATVTSLTQVALTFNDAVLGGDDANLVRVIGPDERYYETECPSLADTVVTSPVALGPAGQYEVEWRVVSSDGHPVSGTFDFTYEPDGSTPAAAGSVTPVCGPADATDVTTSGGGDASGGAGVWIGVGIGAVVLVLVGLGVWLLIRRTGRDDDPDDD